MRGRGVFWVLFLAAALSGCAAAGPKHAVVATPVQLTMLFDTGGGQTVISPEVAARIGCQLVGASYGYRMSGERVRFERCGHRPVRLGATAEHETALAIFDINALLPKEFPRLDGVLALDALSEQPFTLELAANRITLESPASLRRRIANATPVNMRIATGVDGASSIVFLQTRSGAGQEIWLELDSGNLAPVQLALPTAAGEPATPQTLSGSIRLSFGALQTEPLAFQMRALVHDGALNVDFIERYVVTLDLAGRRAWLQTLRPDALR